MERGREQVRRRDGLTDPAWSIRSRDPQDIHPLTREELVRHARVIVGELPVPGSHEAPRLPAACSCNACQPSPWGMYAGEIGIALFLAAMGRIDGNPRLAADAHRRLDPLQERVHLDLDGLVQELGLDGIDGVGAGVYGLARAASLQPDRLAAELLPLAARLASRLEPGLRPSPSPAPGGAILGLLALGALTGDPEHLRWARHWGQVAREDTSIVEPRSITALGMIRLAQATAEESWLVSARQILMETDSSRGDSTRTALAILELEPHVEPPLRRILQAALGRALRGRLTGPDQLCCGTMADVELLLQGSHRLGRSQLGLQAFRRAAHVVARRGTVGRYQLGGVGLDREPGLLPGLAGIGYQLLRLGWPDRIPSVLGRE